MMFFGTMTEEPVSTDSLGEMIEVISLPTAFVVPR